MQKSLQIGIAVLLAMLGGWFLCSSGETAVATNETVTAASPPDAPQAAVVVPVAEPPLEATPTPATSERTAAPAVENAQPVCTLRGRCVDEAGQAIPGVLADLTGWVGNDERLAEWCKQHDEPKRISETSTTGGDGGFEFRFWPPPPFQFALRLQGSGVATWSDRWSELPAGTTKDLGDLKLARGTLLRGRVVDADGAPVGKVQVRIEAVGRERTRSGFEGWCSARTVHDGSFVARWALLAGDYKFGIDDQQIERPAQVTLSGEPEQVVEIALRRVVASEAISGVVVDDQGAPVRGVMVHASPGGQGRLVTSDAEGRFRVLRPEGAPEKVRLWLHMDGYEVPPMEQEFAWGRNDLRFVLKKGQGLAVLVVRASDGTPVEDYALRVAPVATGSWSSNDLRPRGKNRHEGGRETVAGLRIGTHQVIVEPTGNELAIGVVPIQVTAAGAPPVVVRLAANTQRTVRVQRADGSPVEGTKVQLVDPLGEPLTDKLPVCALGQWGYTTATKALALATATTDARGEVGLPAPTDRPLGLFLPGPSHVPTLVPVVAFPPEGPFVVTVTSGAVLQGTIGPAAALAEIRRLAGIQDGSDANREVWPSIYLTRNVPGQARFPDLRDRKTMKPDGSFQLLGVPPGRWNVVVQCFRRQARGGDHLEEVRDVVDLVDGQTTTLVLDLSSLLPGELEGLVLHNDAPLAATLLNLQCPVGKDESGEQQWFYEQVTTDGEGRFRTTVRQGEYRLAWNRPRGDYYLSLQAGERAVVRDGMLTRQTFSLQSGTLRLRLIDAAGVAVGKVAIELRDAAGTPRQTLPPTDDEGRTESECAAGSFTAWVLPKRLQDQTARREFYLSHQGQPDPLASVRISLGRVVSLLGATVATELRLPTGWDQ